jgi:hypothetical protein
MHWRILFLALAIAFVGCMYGDQVAVSVTQISGNSYPQTTSDPEIYFEDNITKIARPFEQVALIEVRGARGSSTAELLGRVRQNAKGLGADAVISIKLHYISRQQGELLGQLLDPKNNQPEAYDTVALTGIAIRYK